MKRPISTQHGSATMIITVGMLVVVAVTVGAAAFYMVKNNKKPEVVTSVSAPLSPYDPLEDGDSNEALQSNIANIQSGMQQEELHLKGTDAAVNDTPNPIAAN